MEYPQHFTICPFHSNKMTKGHNLHDPSTMPTFNIIDSMVLEYVVLIDLMLNFNKDLSAFNGFDDAFYKD